MNDEAELLEVVCNRCGSGDEIGSCDRLAGKAGFYMWCFLCDMPTQKARLGVGPLFAGCQALVEKWLDDLESVSKENANEVNKMWVDEQPPFDLLKRVANTAGSTHHTSTSNDTRS